jgi:bifunctional non-homologous end joining protein LigD
MGHLQLNEHIAEHPADVVFRHACKMGLEGIVSKRLGSRYKSGRTADWLKMKKSGRPGGPSRGGGGLGQGAMALMGAE